MLLNSALIGELTKSERALSSNHRAPTASEMEEAIIMDAGLQGNEGDSIEFHESWEDLERV